MSYKIGESLIVHACILMARYRELRFAHSACTVMAVLRKTGESLIVHAFLSCFNDYFKIGTVFYCDIRYIQRSMILLGIDTLDNVPSKINCIDVFL